MKKDSSKYHFFIGFFFLSLLFHFLAFYFLLTLPLISKRITGNDALNSSAAISKKKNIIISKIDPNQFKKLKTLGVKDGKKNIFSLPMNSQKGQRPIFGNNAQTEKNQKKEIKSKGQNNNSSVSLSKLGTLNKRPLINNNSSFSLSKKSDSPKKILLPSIKEYLKNNSQSYPQLSPTHSDLLKSSDFNIVLETPEGVEFDKLNSTEMIFYSFHKRVFESYISSIFKAYEEFKIKNPHINLSEQGKQILRAKVKYDGNGNIQSIFDLNDSSNDKIQEFFHSILEKNKIPNPPKNILNKEGGFNLEFQLIINV